MIDAIMNGLMGAGSFLGGYNQGRDTNADRALREQQIHQQDQDQNMVRMMNQMNLQDAQKKQGYNESLASYARQLKTDPDTMNLAPDKFNDLMANKAYEIEDPLQGNQYSVQANNFRQAEIDQKKKVVETARTNMKAKEELRNFIGGPLATAADEGPEAYDRMRQLALKTIDPDEDPFNYGMLHDVPWRADSGAKLRLGLQNGRQQSMTLHGDAVLEERTTNHAMVDADRKAREARLTAKDAATEAHRTATKKEGKVTAITKQELEQATPFMKKLGLSPTGSEFGQAREEIVGLARQIQAGNKNISMAHALTKAADWVQATEIKPVKVPGGWASADTERPGWKMAGATSAEPITWDGKVDSLMPGRYYSFHNKDTGQTTVGQWNGTAMTPVQ